MNGFRRLVLMPSGRDGEVVAAARTLAKARRDWRRIAGRALREKDCDFLDSLLNWPSIPTERQRAWLDDLYRRYGYRP